MLPAFDRERIISEAFVSGISGCLIDCKPIELTDECGQNRMHIAYVRLICG